MENETHKIVNNEKTIDIIFFSVFEVEFDDASLHCRYPPSHALLTSLFTEAQKIAFVSVYNPKIPHTTLIAMECGQFLY